LTGGWLDITGPAFLVHAWLLLLLLGGMITPTLNAFFRAVGCAQWFIKRGSSHPLDDIGMIASAVVFLGAAAWQGMIYFVFR